jgi:hypothetical protein
MSVVGCNAAGLAALGAITFCTATVVSVFTTFFFVFIQV